MSGPGMDPQAKIKIISCPSIDDYRSCLALHKNVWVTYFLPPPPDIFLTPPHAGCSDQAKLLPSHKSMRPHAATSACVSQQEAIAVHVHKGSKLVCCEFTVVIGQPPGALRQHVLVSEWALRAMQGVTICQKKDVKAGIKRTVDSRTCFSGSEGNHKRSLCEMPCYCI